jgi:circadian clock protein KaiC
MTPSPPTRISTGVPGLDEILDGGLIPGRSYLVRGDPGTGKTILGINYLTANIDSGETVLFVNLEESKDEVQANAATLGIDLSGLHFLDLSPTRTCSSTTSPTTSSRRAKSNRNRLHGR